MRPAPDVQPSVSESVVLLCSLAFLIHRFDTLTNLSHAGSVANRQCTMARAHSLAIRVNRQTYAWALGPFPNAIRYSGVSTVCFGSRRHVYPFEKGRTSGLPSGTRTPEARICNVHNKSAYAAYLLLYHHRKQSRRTRISLDATGAHACTERLNSRNA